MENKDLIKLLEKMGLVVKSVHSTVDDSDVERVKNQINLSRKEGVVEQRVKPTVIRRRVMPHEVPSPAPEVVTKEEVTPPVERKKMEAPVPEAAEIKTSPDASTPVAVSPTPLAPPPGAVEIPAPEKAKEGAVPVEPPPVAAQEALSVEALPAPPLERAEPFPQEKPVVVEKPKISEKPPVKPKKKQEPAKIIERPAVPPPSLLQDRRPMEKRAPGAIVPPTTVPVKPRAILQRPAPATGKPTFEEEEKGRRGKKLKKDVQVLEEGRRARVITTKKRSFKEQDYTRGEDWAPQTFGFSREPRARGPKMKGAKPVIEHSVPKAIKRKIRISEAILVGELAKRMGIKASEVIKKLMELGVMVTINQAIGLDAAMLVATDFGYEVEKTGLEIEDLVEEKEEHPEDLSPRPPVVTIMGHVDHGKTSLLDAIRQTNVTAGEAGGITQHIGAYEVDVDHRKIVFLDTPGHEAFTAMRARGAQVTDLVVLVVAADDGVMTQTIEAINHAKAAKVPLIVAVNKIDKPNANPERVKQSLTEYGLVPEAWGGQTIVSEISAKQKIGLKEFLEMILIQADVLELKANFNRPMTGAVIEAKLDKGRGPVATVLVQNGTLHVGDAFVSGVLFGRVRALINDRGQKMETAGPSTPVEVIGFPSVPNAGDSFVVITDERRAKELATQRLQKQRELDLAKTSKISLEEFFKKMQKGDVKDLNLILKADVQGSIEAVTEALKRLSTETVHVNILHGGVGSVHESDCMLASASDAIIIGFNVKVEPKAQALAEQEKIDVRLYSVIYDAINDVRKAMEGLLEPVYEERLLGRTEVRQLFKNSRVGTIAGCYILEGKLVRGSHAHVVRDGKMIHEGTIATMKRVKDDIKEASSGFECGITIGNFQDFMVNDIIESYTIEKGVAQL